MGTMEQFINYLNEQADNLSIYVWGGQGEPLSGITDQKIKLMETNAANAARAIAKKDKTVAAGKSGVARIFDCSGLITYWLMKAGLLQYDTTANGLKNLCVKLTGRASLQTGDFVFRVSGGNAYHVGVYIGGGKVAEAKGRDDGVVVRGIDASGAGYWNAYGRPEKFFGKGAAQTQPVAEPTPAQTGAPVLSRVLKLTSPYMRGEDVRQAQRYLMGAKISVGSTGADGVFGGATEKAVRAYQSEKNRQGYTPKLAVDGKIGRCTWQAFGGKWGA